MKRIAPLLLLFALAFPAAAEPTLSRNDSLRLTREQIEAGYAVCPKCDGDGCKFCDKKGGFRLSKCAACDGAGTIEVYRIQQEPEPGKSDTITQECAKCNGTGYLLVPGKRKAAGKP